jgi:hypothetical protein
MGPARRLSGPPHTLRVCRNDRRSRSVHIAFAPGKRGSVERNGYTAASRDLPISNVTVEPEPLLWRPTVPRRLGVSCAASG